MQWHLKLAIEIFRIHTIKIEIEKFISYHFVISFLFNRMKNVFSCGFMSYKWYFSFIRKGYCRQILNFDLPLGSPHHEQVEVFNVPNLPQQGHHKYPYNGRFTCTWWEYAGSLTVIIIVSQNWSCDRNSIPGKSTTASPSNAIVRR